MDKLYFKLDQKGSIIAYALCYFLIPFGIIMLLRTNNDNAFLIGILVSILLLIIFNQVIFSINGIRIKDNKVRIIAKYKIRTFNYDDINKVDVTFDKIKDYYFVEAKVKLNSHKEVIFRWDLVKSRYINYHFKINEDNVYYYLDKLNSFDKFETRIKN